LETEIKLLNPLPSRGLFLVTMDMARTPFLGLDADGLMFHVEHLRKRIYQIWGNPQFDMIFSPLFRNATRRKEGKTS
jgi:hypothetical protein